MDEILFQLFVTQEYSSGESSGDSGGDSSGDFSGDSSGHVEVVKDSQEHPKCQV